MNKSIEEKISELISDFKKIDIVKELNMSDFEIKQNISNISLYLKFNKTCENNGLDYCSNSEKFHIVFLRNNNGDIECQYEICPKHFKKNNISNMYNFYGINNSLESYELNFNNKMINIDIDRNNRGILLKTLIDQIKNNDYHGLYIYGNTGVGKSYIMTAFLNKLVQKEMYVNFIDINESINYVKSNFGNYDLDEYYQKVKFYDILLIDNLGIENFRNFYHNQFLIPILEYRFKNKKPTYFISSLSIDELKKKYINNIINIKGDVTKNDVYKLIDLISGLSNKNIELKGKSQR